MSFNIRKNLALAAGVALTCAGISTAANAGYQCKAPPTQFDKKACELAKHDSPKELVQYVRVLKPIYNMNAEDYVTSGDAARWEIARANADKPASVDVALVEKTKVASK